MMRVSIPSDKDFNYIECKSMYDYFKPIVKDDSSFDDVIKNTLFYAFYDDDKLSLCVYFFKLKHKLWVNGYGIRKNHLFNKKCFKTALTWFNCDVWAECPHKAAVFGLLSSGFEKYKDDYYVYRRISDTT